MPGGGKGPVVMLIRGQMMWRQAYINALGFNNYYGAVTAIIGWGNILPKEAKFIPASKDDPEIRALFLNDSLDGQQEKKIRAWCVREVERVEKATSEYVFKIYNGLRRQRSG